MVKSLLRNIFRPIQEQPVMFISMFFLLGLKTLRFTYGYILGHDVDSSHNLWMFIEQLSIVSLFSYLLCCLSYYLKIYRLGKFVSWTFGFILFSVELFLNELFDTEISPNILTLLLETTPSESGDFFTTFMFTGKAIRCYLLIVGFVFVVFVLNKIWEKYKSYALKNPIYVIIVNCIGLFTLACGLSSCTTYVRLFSKQTSDDVSVWKQGDKTKPVDFVSNIIYSLRHIYVSGTEAKQAILITQQECKEVKSFEEREDSLTIVLVIGESYIKHHSSLYGYNLTTCPNMENEKSKGNLFALTNVTTPYAQTSKVVRNILYCNNISCGENWFDTPYFPALFHSAGYHVTMLDNQKTMDVNQSYTFTLNALLYNDTISDLSYDFVNDTGTDYDGVLVEKYKNQRTADGQRSLVIYHFVGQHFNAASRYPHTAEFEKFSTKDIERTEAWLTEDKKQQIAYYDNATYYNDYVMNKIFDIFHNANAVVVYLSDHGEEVYDYRDSMGRVNLGTKMTNKTVQYLNEVPFIVWVSDKYKQKYPDMVKSLEEKKNNPFSIDNTCQVLFALSSFKPKFYYQERDPLSDLFIPQKRKIYDSSFYEDYLK